MTLLRPFSKFFPQLQVIRRFSSEKPWQEVSIPVPWGQIRGKWWGPTDIRPILTIHGWQDNCGSFDRLIPLLNKDVGFLTIDLPGHGLSSRLPSGVFYYMTNYVLTVKLINDYFKWPKISLMGHSLGGHTCFLYSMCHPHQVDFVASIDGGKPWLLFKRVPYLAECLGRFSKYNNFAIDSVEPPSYTWDEIKEKLHGSNNGSISLEFAHHIMERNTAPSKINPGKYYITRDPRLKIETMSVFSQAELVEYAQRITSPYFVAKAKDASYYEPKENFYEVMDVLKRSSADLALHHIEGTHHAHLNNPEELASLVTSFIRKHKTEDRTIGGIKEECIVADQENPRFKISS